MPLSLTEQLLAVFNDVGAGRQSHLRISGSLWRQLVKLESVDGLTTDENGRYYLWGISMQCDESMAEDTLEIIQGKFPRRAYVLYRQE